MGTSDVNLALRAMTAAVFACGLLNGLTSAVRADEIVADVPAVSARDLGPAPADKTLRLALTLRYRAAEQLDGLVELQAERGSPLYRHWLTSEQFDTAFGPRPADYELLEPHRP
jgi:hypothetical protein